MRSNESTCAFTLFSKIPDNRMPNPEFWSVRDVNTQLRPQRICRQWTMAAWLSSAVRAGCKHLAGTRKACTELSTSLGTPAGRTAEIQFASPRKASPALVAVQRWLEPNMSIHSPSLPPSLPPFLSRSLAQELSRLQEYLQPVPGLVICCISCPRCDPRARAC